MPDGNDDPYPTAEGELSLARTALADGNLPAAAGHIAAALAQAPTNLEVHEALGRLAATSEGAVLDWYPIDGRVSIGAVVARAHLLAATGAYREALDLLAASTAHRPNGNWAAVPWVLDPDLPIRLGPDPLIHILDTVSARLADQVPENERAPLSPYLALARNAVRAYPSHGVLLGTAAGLAARLGQPALAIDWAHRGVQAQPGKITEERLGRAYRSAGRLLDAIAAWQRALRHEPNDLGVYVSIATAFAESGRIDEALDWAERALAGDSTNEFVIGMVCRLRFERDRNVDHLVSLADYTRGWPTDGPDEPGRDELAASCARLPWLSQLPPARETVIDLTRNRTDRDPPLGGRAADERSEGDVPDGDRPAAGPTGPNPGGHLTLDSLEPPSVMSLLRYAFPGTELRIHELMPPDIRSPRRAVGLRPWAFEGTTPSPAVPPPSPQGAAALAQLARPMWPHPPAAYDRAARLAAVPAEDLIGALVHPPALPDSELGRALARRDPSAWMRAIQVWACLGLLHHRADEPWGPSARRRMLVDLAFGVEDWTTEAALFAMITAAWVDPAARSDVAALLRERLADVANVASHRPVTIAWSLGRLALITPGLAADAHRLASEIVAVEEVEEQGRPDDPEPEERTARSAGGLLRRLLPSRWPRM